jgi:hypothetical protein
MVVHIKDLPNYFFLSLIFPYTFNKTYLIDNSSTSICHPNGRIILARLCKFNNTLSSCTIYLHYKVFLPTPYTPQKFTWMHNRTYRHKIFDIDSIEDL